jgi:hypothetical protein
MSDSLFLPRELFQPDASRPAETPPSPTPAARPQRGVQFTSGADVAADLLQAMHGAPVLVERRRKPRSGNLLRSKR